MPPKEKFKKIRLSQGKFSLVDIEDFDFLNQWKVRALQAYNIAALKHFGNFAVLNKTGG